MGNGSSKEEQVYQAVQNSNHNAVKALRRDGASLEFLDREGRTPLILACTRGDLFEMVLMLLNLGANIKAYRPGTYGGYPLHHAAKRGLDKTVLLLLSRGADPLAMNDDSLTPLDMARNRGHVSVVRMIEDRICIFSGVLRELGGPGFLEAIAPQWLTKKIWAVILPTETDPRRTPKFDLVVYQASKVPLPRTVIALAKAEMEQPKYSLPDPMIIILDRNTRSKYKFLAEVGGDKAQLERFFKACKGIPQMAPGASRSLPVPQAILQGLSNLNKATTYPPATHKEPAAPPPPTLIRNPAERRRISQVDGATFKTAMEVSPRHVQGAELPLPHGHKLKCSTSECSSSQSAGPNQVPAEMSTLELVASPSAPPLPSCSSVDLDAAREVMVSQCVVCWDAAAQGVCIPCGHLAGCMECLVGIKGKGWGCPVCRAEIDQIIRVYAV